MCGCAYVRVRECACLCVCVCACDHVRASVHVCLCSLARPTFLVRPANDLHSVAKDLQSAAQLAQLMPDARALAGHIYS